MTITKPILLCVSLIFALPAVTRGAEKYTLHTFQKTQLTDKFFGEGASFGDFNRDGVMDLVSGPYWYAGPKFTERHEYYEANPFDINGYSKNFSAFTHDVNGDDWTDIVIVGFPGEETWWFANPAGKPAGKDGHWQRHVIMPVVDNESPTFTDVTGDGRPELVCSTAGQLGFAELPKDDPTQPWKFQPITPVRAYQRFTHGLGVGDVNGDGRNDILEKDGWWEQPAANVGAASRAASPSSPRLGEPTGKKPEFWKFHEVKFSEPGGAHMYAYDIDGDGDNDVVTSKAAHAYGLAWFENVADEKGEITFNEHLIIGERPEQSEYGVVFTQPHAVALADMDQDGVPDVITGKRFWAHNGNDPGERDPAVLYWFQTVREDGKGRFVPHRIDADSGVGTQVVTGDLNGDKLPDIVVGSKKGTFVFIHQAEEVDREKWEAEQPKRTGTLGAGLRTPPPERPKVSSNSQPGDLRSEKRAGSGDPRTAAASEQPRDADGFFATAADGRRLNLDFETGDLRDWKRVGTAFGGQPIKGETVQPRRADMVSGHAGQYWVGTYEISGDGLQGTLTSVAFPVAHPWATFLVGGGAHELARVEVVLADTDEIIFKASGADTEEMRLVKVNLRPHAGKQIFLRVVDQVGSGWGHVNFDHFRFHDDEPKVPEQPVVPIRKDEYPYAGLSAEEAAKAMKLPPGFSVSVFAAEPDVKQPIAMTLDDRGRVWIAEAYEYPQRAADGQGRDRIVIFEDADRDGRFDNRTVFAEGLNLVSGLEVGFGGVWVGAAPNFMFIPDSDGDDVADGKPQILLDGWGYEDTHETLNSFTWGPDGWLYGCHGVFTHSRVGKPGTPDADRVPLNAGIWRYHPTRHKFEVFAEGTSNPWGVDFDDNGQAFCTACVIPHLFHVVQGARYQRQAGSHFNQHTYADIQTIADHMHYLGKNPHEGNGASDDAGGGHAHAGAMIYLGGKWPKEYHGRIFMNNIHGQRLNMDVLKPEGSGFIGGHGPDFLLTQDRASQMLYFRYGPDGQVFVIDWYDMQACHDRESSVHDRNNGRIYKIHYGENRPVAVDLKKRSDKELVLMLAEKNDWYVRHARRLLQERAAAGKLDAAARDLLADLAVRHFSPSRRLRAMWALHVTGGLPDGVVSKLLRDKDQYVRAWTVQLALDRKKPNLDDVLPQLSAMAKGDPSPVVRMYLASAMQRVPPADRWNVLRGLVRRTGDADDHNLPLMYWYAAEPLAELDPERALEFGLSCGQTMPLVREFMLRRIGALPSGAGLAALVNAAGRSSDDKEQLTILHAIRRALAGQRQVKAPAEWAATYQMLARSKSDEVRAVATGLGVTFGDEAAMNSLRKVVVSAQANPGARRDALQALLAAKHDGLAETLHALLNDPALRDLALTGLALYDNPQTPSKLLTLYPTLSSTDKRAALATMASRAPYALALLQAIAAKQIPAADLPADLVRQLHNLKDETVDEQLAAIWGQVRSTAADKAELIAHYRTLVSSELSQKADVQLGRAVFAKTCQQCHTLYGVGSNIGPDLTGSNRSDIEYLLTNMVDPSALIPKEYQSTVISDMDGRVITGIVSAEDDKSLTIRTATETILLPKDEVDERELSDLSMMPEDQLKQFAEHEIVSLVEYLRGKSQVPMRATKENASLLFNGRDLTGWTGDSQLWSVENGEIIGRSSGLAHNSFLLSDLSAENFRLSFEVKLKDNVGNSGVQFRSEPLAGFNEVRGYQADIGPDWWGKLYEENGRALLWDKPGEQHVKKGEWNRYEIEADGSRIRTWINGEPCVDLDDPAGKIRGIIALQIHSGPAMEVRFRDLQLEIE